MDGLRWRLGERLLQPSADLSSSLEHGLLLALQERASGRLVGCAELSLRPTDGTLSHEFPVPPMFQLHATERLGAHLSNMAVLPTYRRRGLASRLLDACEWVVRSEWGRDELFLHHDLRSGPATARLYASFEPLPEFDAKCVPPTDGADAARTRGAQNRFHRKRIVRQGSA